jgi:hypothetical protein
MTNDELKEQLAALQRDNEALRRENELVRAERKEAYDLIFESLDVRIPTEAEMATQLPTVVPFSVVMTEVDRILAEGQT